MVQILKRWESPRKQGRNDKGKGGTARARQLRKREQMLRQKLKSNGSSNIRKVQATGEGNHTLSFYWQLYLSVYRNLSVTLYFCGH